MTLAAVLFSGGIFLLGFLSLLLVGFSALLNAKLQPLKENQARFDVELKEVKGELKILKAGQASLEKRLDILEKKLDKILARQS